MKKTEFFNEEGINGTGTAFVDIESEDFKLLQRSIIEQASKQTPQQKLELNLISLRLQMEDYLREEKPKKILNAGYFLKELLEELKIKHTTFAEYVGLTKTNLSALIHGKRKLNTDLARKLEAIFNISLDLWLGVENKKELLEIKKEPRTKYRKYKLQDLVHLK